MKCEHDCRDGLVFTRHNKDNTEKVYACPCPLGEKHRQPMFAPSDRDKAKPIWLPVYKPKGDDFKSKQFKDND